MTASASTRKTQTPSQTVLVTGSSSGFGALTALALARAGHVVYASMRNIQGSNATVANDLTHQAGGRDLRPLELDVTSQRSVDAAVAQITREQGALDTVVHNAGHMVLGPAEAFTPEQIIAIYDVNVVGAQRVNRAVLPHLRAQGSGLLVWVGSSSARGGCPPFLGPYFAAKAAMDALAVSYAGELIRFGIDTSIVVPGAFTSGTNHFLHAGHPDDSAVAAEYDQRYGELMKDVNQRLAGLIPADADVTDVADEIARIVAMPAGTRPFRVHIDPSRDGSEVVSAVADRVRVEFFRRVGLEDLLTPASAL